MPGIESRVEALWIAAQTGRGAGGASGSAKRLRKVSGSVAVDPQHGSEIYSDGGRFADATDYIASISGGGAPVIQGTPDVIGYLVWLILGQEAVTGSADPWTHVATPGSGGLWFKLWHRLGATVGPKKQIMGDCRMVSLRIEGSSANPVVKLTPTFISLKAGEIFSVDPVAVVLPEDPLRYSEGVGHYTIDGQVYTGQSSFAIVINDGVTAGQGDDVTMDDIDFGVASVVLEALTIHLNQLGVDRHNTQLYGVANPGVGAMPLKSLPPRGSYSCELIRSASRSMKIEVPSIKWAPPQPIEGNPQGGRVEWPLAGEARPSAGNPIIRVTTKSADPAYVAS